MNRFVFRTGATAHRVLQNRVEVRCLSLSTDKILVDVDSKTGICKMRLNAPPVNILDSVMLDALVKAIKTAESSNDVRGVILSSNFDGKVFCAGLNIMDMYQKSYDQLFDYWKSVQEMSLSWYGCGKPTVAVINGHALGGGCALSLMCDYRFMQADDGKTIGLNETKLGIVAPFSVAALMRSIINYRPSELALLQGTMFEAEKARDIGLVDDIYSLDNLMGKAEKQMKSFISVPPQAYRLTKYLLRQEIINRLKNTDTRDDEARDFAGTISQPSIQESLAKYVAEMKSRKSEK